MKQRFDHVVTVQGLAPTRSQAESYIKLGQIKVDGRVIDEPGFLVDTTAKLELLTGKAYVSRAGLKLASVAKLLNLDFRGKTVLDVGSSTGGFTDYALQHGAKKVYAVDSGKNQLHPSLHGNPKIELHEQTDIRDFTPEKAPDIVVIDVSFVSLRDILPHIAMLAGKKTEVVAMVKPQFEAPDTAKNRGVIKNERMRRDILKDFETWAKGSFVILDKKDSDVAGVHGNRERFYLLKRT